MITMLLATAFAFVGCCIIIYMCCVYCYCSILNIEVNEDTLMDNVYIGVGVMSFIFMLTLFSLIAELTIHLIS